jgi:PKD domain
LAAVAAVAAVALASPVVALAATTYCVHQAGSCPAGQTDEGANLQTALTAAQSSAGNTVLIGAGTYTQSSDFQYASSADSVTIAGAGVGTTVLKTSTPASEVLDLQAPAPSQLSDLTIDETANLSGGFALLLDGPLSSSTTGPIATGIAVTLDTPSTVAGSGAGVGDGASLTNSTIDGPITTEGIATLTDDAITSRSSAVIADGTLTASRLKIAAGANGVEAQTGGDATIDGLLMTGVGPAAGSAAVAQDGGKLTVRSGTFVVTSGSWDEASSTNSAGGASSVTILDSIFSGFTQGTTCTATAGTASMTFGSDDRHVFGSESCSGAGAFTPGAGNIDADPQFVNPGAGDYHLLWSSPAVDTGQTTCGAPCQQSDLDGLVRPVDGNGDGVAVRDMGAFEYGHRAPSITMPAAQPPATVGRPATLSATVSDPDDGDTLSIGWNFDDGTTGAGATVSHTFATAGVHRATVIVADPTGLATTASSSVTVNPAPAPGGPGGPGAPGKDATPPTVRSLRVAPATFAVAGGSTATVAKARPKRRHPRGTKITFRLSEHAKIVMTFRRRTTGIRVGKRCQAPSRAHRHGRRCIRYVAAGKLIRRSEPAATVGFPFTGRIGRTALRPAHYRLALQATDPSGNAGKARTTTFTVVGR